MLYVANSDDDTIEVLEHPNPEDHAHLVAHAPAADPGFGQMPTDLALSSDGETLYVTCGGSNAVAVVRLPALKISGYIPTGWFPIALAEEGRQFVCRQQQGPRRPAPLPEPRVFRAPRDRHRAVCAQGHARRPGATKRCRGGKQSLEQNGTGGAAGREASPNPGARG